MREKLETLSLAKLKEFAKEQEIKGYGSMRKAELIDILCAKAEEKEGISAPAVVSTGNDEPSANDVEPAKKAGEPVKREAEPAKEEKAPAPAQTQAAPANRVNPNEKKRTVIRSYRQEGTQRTGNYRQSQSDAVERNDRQDRPEQRQERNDRQERQEQRQDMNRMESIRETAEEARPEFQPSPELQELDSGVDAYGILEVMPDGFGFIRCENYLPGENDVYVAPSQIRRFNMKTGDIIQGSRRVKTAAEKFAALLFVKYINGYPASAAEHRPNFENMTPIFPNERLHMETTGGRNTTAMRVLDLLSPIGKGQRGMIVSPPKAGKTTLLKQVAKAVTVNHPDMHVIILLIDERPEEVTDIKESITGNNVEVLYSTFDELPERHKRVSEMVIERAKRLVEHGRDVIILLDSITRLARAYNLTVAPSGRTLSGGLDPAALHMPKRFFGAARNMREGGSLTILATALVDTGSRMDDVIYEEFKGTGNMELVLDRKLSEKRIFPAIDILKSGTRRDDLLLTREEAEAVDLIRKATNTLKAEDAVEKILDLFTRTRTNREFVDMSKKIFRY
ncbi:MULTISPECIES: transcription termination factor Rho [Hungatella]|uniref:Transcription termination factor Rho n=1 Tax=Hungatella hathewayi TaxID=154046 RepID=A0AAW9WEZ0_9FIRM|nr:MULTISPECIES: transcription termination factor Rho [Hungatella]MCD7967395.1 transcription termination factor Rho [Clostridiaceae bacterium]MCQ4828872.1 transcription termination factor Rho [Hungatella sp. SL.1.14]MUB63960.1 transcription termination factor Rho [Hungatella hathewayi]CUQ25171.1 transcription termination factor Rho [Hungatella hathewayi]